MMDRSLPLASTNDLPILAHYLGIPVVSTHLPHTDILAHCSLFVVLPREGCSAAVLQHPAPNLFAAMGAGILADHLGHSANGRSASSSVTFRNDHRSGRDKHKSTQRLQINLLFHQPLSSSGRGKKAWRVSYLFISCFICFVLRNHHASPLLSTQWQTPVRTSIMAQLAIDSILLDCK